MIAAASREEQSSVPSQSADRVAARLRAARLRAMHVALWLLVASGPALAVPALLKAERLEARARLRVPATPAPGDTGRVEGFAELYVTAFLEGAAPAPQSAPLDRGGHWRAASTVSLGARRLGDGYFAVTVAAAVLGWEPSDVGEGGWVPAGTRLDGLEDVPELFEAVVRFLSAYLTGDGELDRYLVPGATISPLTPPSYEEVEVLEGEATKRSPASWRVGVVVRVSDTAGRAQILEYWLEVAERDGRFEVAGLHPAPPLPTDRQGGGT